MKDDSTGFGSLINKLRNFLGKVLGVGKNETDESAGKSGSGSSESKGIKGVHDFEIGLGPDIKSGIGEMEQRLKDIDIIEELIRFPEPLTDVIAEDDKVTIVMELPDVTEDEISYELGDHYIVIHTKNKDVAFNKRFELPFEPDAQRIETKLSNCSYSVTIFKKG